MFLFIHHDPTTNLLKYFTVTAFAKMKLARLARSGAGMTSVVTLLQLKGVISAPYVLYLFIPYILHRSGVCLMHVLPPTSQAS